MNKNESILGLTLFVLLLLSPLSELSAQQRSDYWGNSELYLQDQASFIFEQAYKVLDTYPPVPEAGIERKLALSALDALLHDTHSDKGEAFYRYMEFVGQRIVDALKKEKNPKEIRFFRFYNHGFIVRTPTITIGIDLIKGGSQEKPFFTDSLMRSIVSQCDILFVTHAHGDHANFSVAKMFCEQNKPVIVPTGLWENESPCIKPIRGASVVKESFSLPGLKAPLVFYVFPGHQDDMLNNVYAIVTPEGKTVMHTGDQSNTGDLKWIAQIRNQVKTDVLLAHCWMRPLNEIITAIQPALVISGHENEMGHTIDHREAYWLTFRRMANIKPPYIVMAWGESYLFPL
ncbi:MAG: hypothetical protein LBS88_01715 [Tannerellaceae bacterium]|jgi:L-ascorbate metabolism protein UlaG (beta-lactamase superfamily)|nr:hypothetical protein [Tannerellaceae bacterium]